MLVSVRRHLDGATHKAPGFVADSSSRIRPIWGCAAHKELSLLSLRGWVQRQHTGLTRVSSVSKLPASGTAQTLAWRKALDQGARPFTL